jgi:hypothetical protein
VPFFLSYLCRVLKLQKQNPCDVCAFVRTGLLELGQSDLEVTYGGHACECDPFKARKRYLRLCDACTKLIDHRTERLDDCVWSKDLATLRAIYDAGRAKRDLPLYRGFFNVAPEHFTPRCLSRDHVSF